ncbi:MAG: chemotaxis protein CheW [Spirochaetaceae bacterium]|jgi:purine-binding chemotaxis protein CheW|nr:chemotaxis protein CheW [Spirochaetaceae bacterium]
MANQFLAFMLDGSRYAVEVYQVQEVLEYTQITKVPCAAPFVEGLINSRGQGISVVNLRKKFSLPEIEINRDTRIIVIEIQNGEDSVTFGAIADSVQEVIDLDENEIEKPPKFGNAVAAEFIRGIGKRDGEFIIILDVGKVFSSDEINVLEGAGTGAGK